MLKQSFARKYEASRRFQWTNSSTLTAGSETAVSWETEDTASQKYLPFNFTRISNNGESDILFYPNQDSTNPILIESGVIITLDRTSLPAVSSFKVKNNGSTTISANKITITNSNEGQTADSVVGMLFKKFHRAGAF